MEINKKGLTAEEAALREKRGDGNKVKRRSNQSYFSIIFRNIFTYFNAIFAIISILLISSESYRELTFLPIIFANVIIGIFQQVRSKIVIDSLNLLAQAEYTVIRDGKQISLPADKLVLGDLVVLKGGQQIPADGVVESGDMLVNVKRMIDAALIKPATRCQLGHGGADELGVAQHGVSPVAGRKDTLELNAHALARHSIEQRRALGKRLFSLRLDHKIQTAGKTHRAQHAKRVLVKTTLGISNGADELAV